MTYLKTNLYNLIWVSFFSPILFLHGGNHLAKGFHGNLGELIPLPVVDEYTEFPLSEKRFNSIPGELFAANDRAPNEDLVLVPESSETSRGSELLNYDEKFNGSADQGTDENSSASLNDGSGIVLPYLNANFFADSLNSNFSINEDPMGTQRLIEVKNSKFTSVVSANSSFKYTSNPDKSENPSRKDGTVFDISYGYTINLGEYVVGESVFTPSFNFAQMRTLNDIPNDFGNEMSVYDVDVYIAGISLPFIFPNDYSLILSHSYTAPYTFRKNYQQISYSNSPSLTASRNMLLQNGDNLTFSASVGYTFSESDTLKETINDDVYYQFLEAVMGGANVVQNRFPSNLQDSFMNVLSLVYTKQIDEDLLLMPSFSYQYVNFAKGDNSKRSDRTYNAGVALIKSAYDWLNLSLSSNYTRKNTSSSSTPIFDDFQIGVGCNVFYSF